MRQVEAGKVSAIVVWRLDRLGRTAKGLTALLQELFEQKVGWLVPNDYPMASSSLNKGVPLTVHAPRAALTQWYVSQAAILAGEKPVKAVGAGENSLLSRYWGGLTFSPKAKA